MMSQQTFVDINFKLYENGQNYKKNIENYKKNFCNSAPGKMAKLQSGIFLSPSASERVHYLSHISCSVYLLVVVRSDFSTDSSIEEYLGLRRSTYVARPNPSILPFFPSLFPAFFLSFFRFFLLSFFAVWRVSAPQEPKKSPIRQTQGICGAHYAAIQRRNSTECSTRSIIL